MSRIDQYREAVRNAREKWADTSTRDVLFAHLVEMGEDMSLQEKNQALDELDGIRPDRP